MSGSNRVGTGILLAVVLALLGTPAVADYYTWTGGDDGINWTDADNWSPNSGPPSLSGDTAEFGTDGIDYGAVLLDGSQLTGTIKFTDGAYSLSNVGACVLTTGEIDVTGGTGAHSIATLVAIQGDGGSLVLTLSGGSLIDAGSLTISGQITADVTATIGDFGTLTLQNANNNATLTGMLTVNSGGTLVGTKGRSLGAAQVVVHDGGKVSLTQTTVAATYAANTLTVDGNVGLALKTSGTATGVVMGSLNAAAAGATVNVTGTAPSGTFGAVTLNGNLTLNNSVPLTLGALNDTGATEGRVLAKKGIGDLNLSTVTGTVGAASTLEAWNGNTNLALGAFGTGTVAMKGGTVTLTGAASDYTGNPINVSGSGLVVAGNNHVLMTTSGTPTAATLVLGDGGTAEFSGRTGNLDIVNGVRAWFGFYGSGWQNYCPKFNPIVNNTLPGGPNDPTFKGDRASTLPPWATIESNTGFTNDNGDGKTAANGWLAFNHTSQDGQVITAFADQGENSAYFEGYLMVPTTTTYRFRLPHDDPGELYIPDAGVAVQATGAGN